MQRLQLHNEYTCTSSSLTGQRHAPRQPHAAKCSQESLAAQQRGGGGLQGAWRQECFQAVHQGMLRSQPLSSSCGLQPVPAAAQPCQPESPTGRPANGASKHASSRGRRNSGASGRRSLRKRVGLRRPACPRRHCRIAPPVLNDGFVGVLQQGGYHHDM